jgi:hypothetical protein
VHTHVLVKFDSFPNINSCSTYPDSVHILAFLGQRWPCRAPEHLALNISHNGVINMAVSMHFSYQAYMQPFFQILPNINPRKIPESHHRVMQRFVSHAQALARSIPFTSCKHRPHAHVGHHIFKSSHLTTRLQHPRLGLDNQCLDHTVRSAYHASDQAAGKVQATPHPNYPSAPLHEQSFHGACRS